MLVFTVLSTKHTWTLTRDRALAYYKDMVQEGKDLWIAQDATDELESVVLEAWGFEQALGLWDIELRNQ